VIDQFIHIEMIRQYAYFGNSLANKLLDFSSIGCILLDCFMLKLLK